MDHDSRLAAPRVGERGLTVPASLHARAKDVFLQVVRLPASQRSSYLDEACGDDLALRQEVEGLLSHHQSQTVFPGGPLLRTAFRLANALREDGRASDRASNAHPVPVDLATTAPRISAEMLPLLRRRLRALSLALLAALLWGLGRTVLLVETRDLGLRLARW